MNKRKKIKKKKSGCLGSALYVGIVVLVSIVLAVVVLGATMDISGLGKSSKTVTVSIPKGANTQNIADILADQGLIDHPLLFRLYSRFTGADGTYQPHDELDLAPSMGYSSLISAIQESKPRESVSVTIPEGITVPEIAKLLEKNKVCSASDFMDTLINGDFSDYAFLKNIPTAEDDERYANRLYRLEGYLFPDTYQFYVNGSAETVIRKMLNNFEKRVSTSLLAGFEARGMTLDEAVVMASIIQAEVSDPNDMARVSRVLYNRLEEGSDYPRLQCDTTQLYLKGIVGSYDDSSDLAKAYDTYLFEGLPIGAIGNPGLDALEAVARPSSEAKVKDCYFFVADVRTGETFYSKTWKQHLKKCKELGLA